jgi:hypothetical protein
MYLSYWVWLAAAVEWCGAFGCSDRWAARNPVASILLCVAVGVILALPLIAIPWSRTIKARRITAVFVFLGGSLGSLISIAILKEL